MNNKHSQNSTFVGKRQSGFTLIELLITVAIIGILGAIAYPNYLDSVKKSRRSDAKGALMGLTNAMERFYTENSTYQGAATGGGNSGPPTIFATQSPLDNTTKFYNLNIDSSTGTAFIVSATPITTTPQNSDYCGKLTTNQVGTKAAIKGGVAVSGCW